MEQKEMTAQDAWIAMARGECVKTDMWQPYRLLRRDGVFYLQFYSNKIGEGWMNTDNLPGSKFSIVPDPSKPEKKELRIKILRDAGAILDDDRQCWKIGSGKEMSVEMALFAPIDCLVRFIDESKEVKGE